MFEKLEIFGMAQGLARHSAARQSTIAENIANADTPNYRARDLKPFAEAYHAPNQGEMRATRSGHVGADLASRTDISSMTVERAGAMSPNGNNVSLEQEMMTATMVKGRHDRALAVYKSSLNVLRTAANGGR